MTSRRTFLRAAASLASVPFVGTTNLAFGAGSDAARYDHLLVLVELKGGNDGLNTVVPYADPAYASLRPKLAIPRDQVVQLTERVGLHPSLAPLRTLFEARELAILQGVGYPDPNLSHFRSIEIWDTASRSDEYVGDGWLARTFAARPVPAAFVADGVVVGSSDMGPLSGRGSRAIALADPAQFLRRARLAKAEGTSRNPALAHILAVEANVVEAAGKLEANHPFDTQFPAGPFGGAVRTAAQVIANHAGVAAVRLTLNGFDTHANQAPTQARLLGELAQGVVALRSALVEIGRWETTLVLTYAEFGRRPRENASAGTDHGTASAHFALGGRVKGGLFGAQPDLAGLSGEGNVTHAIDFREIYATVLDRWWSVDPRSILHARFAPLPFVAA